MPIRRAQDESDLPAVPAARERRALTAAGSTRLEQLTQVTVADLLKFRGVGPKALEQLRRALAEHQLSFAKDTQSARAGTRHAWPLPAVPQHPAAK